MKKFFKNTEPSSATMKDTRMTVSDFLRKVSEVFRTSDRRLFSRREATDLVFALRSALASPARLLVQDSLTQECYRYLTLVNRTPISGYSLIACLGADLPRQLALSSRLQTLASDYTGDLRSGTMTPEEEVPDCVQDLYLDYVDLLSRSTCRFDVDIAALDAAIKPVSTYHTLQDFIFEQFDQNPHVPESFVEAFVLAHCYLFRLSLLD